MSVANSTPSSPQQDLTALARRIRDAHQAIGAAMRNALRMALDGGDALIEARSLVAASHWGRWLRVLLRAWRFAGFKTAAIRRLAGRKPKQRTSVRASAP
jgi:hypothetical protein